MFCINFSFLAKKKEKKREREKEKAHMNCKCLVLSTIETQSYLVTDPNVQKYLL